MQLLILTTDKKAPFWASLSNKLQAIKKPLKIWDVSIKYVEATPIVKDGRIDSLWLDQLFITYYRKGFDVVGLHMSDAQRKKWKVMPTRRGSNPRQSVGFYFWSDEHTKRKGLSQFVQTCLHEFGHEYYQQTGYADIVDTYHAAEPNIGRLVETFLWEKYTPKSAALKKEISRLQLLVATLKAAFTPGDLRPLVKRQAALVEEDMAMLGMHVRITQGFRSIEEQNKLYAQGRTTPGAVVTNAKGGESLHNYGVAVDFVFRKEGYNVPDSWWTTLGYIGKRHGFEWGGDWKNFRDRPHFEMTLGHTLADFKNKKIDYTKYV